MKRFERKYQHFVKNSKRENIEGMVSYLVSMSIDYAVSVVKMKDFLDLWVFKQSVYDTYKNNFVR